MTDIPALLERTDRYLSSIHGRKNTGLPLQQELRAAAKELRECDPVAWIVRWKCSDGSHTWAVRSKPDDPELEIVHPLYTSPPRQPLSEAEILTAVEMFSALSTTQYLAIPNDAVIKIARAIEARIKE